MPVVAALCCAGLLALAAGWAGARARPVTAHTAGCGNGQSTSISLFGSDSHLISESDVPVCATGRVTVAFAGDPAAGCAAEGLCDYSGTETFAPDGSGDLSLVRTSRHGRITTSGTLFLGGAGMPAASAVQRTAGTGTATRTTACSDTLGNGNDAYGVFDTLQVAGGRVRIDLLRGQAALLGSRCAGPLDMDIASALPAHTVPVGRLERGGTRIDLAGSGRFTAHGWSGTVTSTIMLTLGRPRHAPQTYPPSSHRRSRTPRVPTDRIATADYRVTRLAGSATATVRSSAAAAVCGPFDACGLGGTITVSPGPSVRGTASLSSLPSRAPRRALLAALLGSGRASMRLGGGGQATVHGSVQARLTQDGGTCSDTVALHRFTIELVRVRRGLEVAVRPADSAAADPLRTRCPGPDLGPHMLADGLVPLARLRHRAFTVALAGRPFSDGPYQVMTSSTLSVSLRRTSIRLQPLRPPRPAPAPSRGRREPHRVSARSRG